MMLIFLSYWLQNYSGICWGYKFLFLVLWVVERGGLFKILFRLKKKKNERGKKQRIGGGYLGREQQEDKRYIEVEWLDRQDEGSLE